MGNKIRRIAAPPRDSPSLPNLPEEMLTEILMRLPVKTLLLFRCVSKSWLFLISSNDFVKAHLKFSAKNDVYIHDKLIFGSRKFPIDLYTCSLHSLVEDYGHAITDSIYLIIHENVLFDRACFDFADPYGVIQLVGSCNGLVCVDISPNIILWNPTTRESRMLPDSGTSCRCHVTYGFGYDELHDDYKVVESSAIKYNLTGEDETCEDDIQVKVYSMRTDSWKTILSNWSIFLNGANYEPVGHESSIFLNGAIHWLVHELSHWGIVSLNLATDTFVVLPMPNFGDDDNVTPKVNILGGCLAVCRGRNVCMDVWVMKEYGVRESWTKFVSIPFFMDFSDTPFVTPKPLFLSIDGKILMNYGSSLRIFDSLHRFDFDLEVVATAYIESLLSPDLDDGIKH